MKRFHNLQKFEWHWAHKTNGLFLTFRSSTNKPAPLPNDFNSERTEDRYQKGQNKKYQQGSPTWPRAHKLMIDQTVIQFMCYVSVFGEQLQSFVLLIALFVSIFTELVFSTQFANRSLPNWYLGPFNAEYFSWFVLTIPKCTQILLVGCV